MYNILKPINIGSITVKNRIAYLGMGKMLGTPENFISERQIAYYENYAKNGVGMITTGACIVFNDYPSQLPCQPGLYDDKFIPGIQKLTDAIHKHGAKIFMQPWHPGNQAYGCDPSQCRSPADFSVDEIHDIQRRFIEAAVRAQKGGCDGVEWHMAHNYLPEQFAVKLFNKRSDEYSADNAENSARFSREVIEGIKKACGKDFPVTLKINGWDMGFEGGITPEYCAEICKILVDAGVDMITVSAGGGGTDITGMSGDGYREEGWKIGFAETVKKAVNVPVMASGSIRHLDVMEKAIAEGKCDMIGMGRGLLAEPEFVKKVEEGRINELRYCLSCMSCFNPDMPSKQHCSVNPVATWEFETKELNAEDGQGRKVVIVGAGPAGINAAVTLAKRGFKPVIYDKSAQLGGSIRYASAPDGKAKLKWALGFYAEELERLNIPVHLNTEATEEIIASENPYAVFVSSGSDPIRPAAIPGIMGENVLMAREVLDYTVPEYTDEQIVVIGGGMVGMEIATTFAHKGCKSTIIEMQVPEQLMGSFPVIAAFMHLQPSGVIPMFAHTVKEITDHSVIAVGPEGNEVEVPATKVIIAMGFTPNTRLYDELKDKFDNVVLIGDANGVDNIAKAAREGYVAAESLN